MRIQISIHSNENLNKMSHWREIEAKVPEKILHFG